MNLKICLAVLCFFLVLLFSACSSGQYRIEEGSKDSSKAGGSVKDINQTIDQPLIEINIPKHNPPKDYMVRTPPDFTVTLTGGINLGVSELSSNFSNIFEVEQFANGENFGVRNGWSILGMGKITLQNQGNIRLNIIAGYSKFKNNFLNDDSPFGSVKYNIITFGAGLENNFNPKYQVRPYAGIEVNGNMISGEVNLNDTALIKIKNSFRIGVSINAGVEYLITDKFGLNFAFRFTHANLLLRSSKDDGTSNEISLRDKQLDPPIFASGFKNFAYVSFQAGLCFYFGIKKQVFRI